MYQRDDVFNVCTPKVKKATAKTKFAPLIARGTHAKQQDKKTIVVKKPTGFQTVRGMRDIIPFDERYWDWILTVWERIVRSYGYEKIETPLMEEYGLFKRSVGDMTDVVQKQMYVFEDQSGAKMALRPEATASMARAYIEHGMLNLSQPVKLYQIGPMFRYERPQSGRFRQFHQFDVEVMGEAAPVADAELILLAYTLLQEIGLDSTIQVNSIGCVACRNEYKKVLLAYLKPKKSQLCEDCIMRMARNPLRALDCKEESCVQATTNAPQMMDYLDDACKKHFVGVLEHLDELDLPYVLNSRIVRGLDYYTRTAFELFLGTEADEVSRQSAVGGGGRYDTLISELGGRQTPASGFAIGLERVIGAMRDRNIEPPKDDTADIYLAQIGDNARKRALKMFEQLRKAGFRIIGNLSKDGLRQQLELANKKKVKFAVIIGQQEMIDNTVLIRDMEGGIQEMVDYKKVEKELEKRLAKK